MALACDRKLFFHDTNNLHAQSFVTSIERVVFLYSCFGDQEGGHTMSGHRLRGLVRPLLDDHLRIRSLAKHVYLHAARTRHSVARLVPSAIAARPRQLTVAITAHCNLRCAGCRYGRDFMPGQRLALSTVIDVLTDAKAGGIERVRFYGGEPLLHPDLPAMVRHACELGLYPYITTNGTHLGLKIRPLYDAGLRLASIGFYGIGDAYEAYTQRPGHFRRLEQSLEAVRRICGSGVELQLNFVLLRPTCTVDAVRAAWHFAERYDMYFHVDLGGTSIPFFTAGPDGELLLRPDDREAAEAVAREMLTLRRRGPRRFLHSEAFIRSIPDWLIKGPAMRVPCDAYELLWVGADGTLQLCDTALPLGNVNRQRLRDILFSPEHQRAARCGFRLNCPNCTCLAESRIQKDLPSLRRYARPLPGEEH